MTNMDVNSIANSLKEQGVSLSKIKMLTGGANHTVYSGVDDNDKVWIIKFPTVRETEKQFQGDAHRDTLFGGELSLERECYLFDLVREGDVPVPFAKGIFETPYGPCVIVECTPGMPMDKYMHTVDHDFQQFLSIMKSLGSQFSRLHKMRFPSFGNIMTDREIEPAGIMNFAERYMNINKTLMDKCKIKGGLNDEEYIIVEKFFEDKFNEYKELLDIKNSPATLVITDMHGGNFFVENGEVSGYFDVESSQAAPWQFELYSMRFFVFNFYGDYEFKEAEKAFWNAYFDGERDFPTKQDDELIDFFSICRVMEIFQSYWGHIDGLRDTWGERIKVMLFKYIDTGVVDYSILEEIWRERDCQPKSANNIK